MASLSRSTLQPKPLRLLIVDDNPDVLHDLRLLLELSDDMRVVGQANNGMEAVQMASTLLPDVVIMDLELPGLDGCEATRRIKSQRTAPRIIILSMHASPVDRDQARDSGADDFVVKGSSYETLKNAILGIGESSTSSNSHS